MTELFFDLFFHLFFDLLFDLDVVFIHLFSGLLSLFFIQLLSLDLLAGLLKCQLDVLLIGLYLDGDEIAIAKLSGFEK